MLQPTILHTAHGYEIRVRRVGVEIEMETSAANGDVISTVRMSEDDAFWLMDELRDEVTSV